MFARRAPRSLAALYRLGSLIKAFALLEDPPGPGAPTQAPEIDAVLPTRDRRHRRALHSPVRGAPTGGRPGAVDPRPHICISPILPARSRPTAATTPPRVHDDRRAAPRGGPSLKEPAASYSPGPLRAKYHRR